MNAIEMRREAARMQDEIAGLLNKRNWTSADEARSNVLVAQVDALRAQADAYERREGFSGVVKPAGYYPTSGGTRDRSENIFCRWLRTGDEGARTELRSAVIAEYRASNDTDMNIGTAADGGDLVPTGHYQGIIAKARPMALYDKLGVRMIPGQGTTVDVPIDNEADDGAFVATNEAAGYDRDAPAVSQVQMTLVKYTKKIELSVELLQDEDSRLLDFLNTYVGQGFAATVNDLLVTEALANGTAALTFDSATAIGGAEIPELLYKLSAEYANGAQVAWLANRTTEGYIRGLNGNNFQFAPTPSGLPGRNAELFGVPIYSDGNMPAIGAGNKSLLIGNWDYMLMRLDPAMTLLRDPYTLGHLGQVRLLYMFRTVVKMGQGGAAAYGTHPTA